MPHYRYAREDRHPEQANDNERDAHLPAPDGDHTTHEDGAHGERAPVGEPLDLLALGPPRPAHPDDERGGGRHHGSRSEDGTRDRDSSQNGAVDTVGVRDPWEFIEWSRLQRVARDEADNP